MEDFMRFEAHISSSTQGKASAKAEQVIGSGRATKKNQGWRTGTDTSTGKDSQVATKPSNQKKGKTDIAAMTKSQDKKCFKCGNLAHGVFQCPEVSGPAEAKELYESKRQVGRY
ncbi:hypothetical protein L915_20996 [Phytophthora nicotianae]|uniref:CCHC-type domain-containing protein n=2 Tax=Phytophthora nicotianae TaxID=4792 RepID=V9DXN4_PHYNI|nr:hypothetical protein F443_21607 [Phytophthora nicotianae P1569]ETK71822.1 hypothetical protein L915_20996 [Phytophthora nicotianae]ETL25255.1 hypothetical protein L916_20874 [Phytophthora nicotianae]ETM31751.1 hypothetical protein L914_20733 [Phytophthora nicotianae]